MSLIGIHKKILEIEKINLISDFPPQSPDLNPIENIWGIMKNRADLSKVSSQQDLFNKVKKIWDELTLNEIQNLITSVPRRINSVIQAKGNNTKY